MAADHAPGAPDTAEMVLVHRLFLQEYTAAVALVRAVRAGDTARAAVVAGHLGALGQMLTEHHRAEDELLWPRLAADPALDAAVVARMEEQHEHIAAALARLHRALPQWAAGAEPDLTAQVAHACTVLLPALEEHLGDEERHILPLVPGRFTAAQWAQLSARGRAAVPPAHRLYMLAALGEAAGNKHRQEFLRRLPAPVRLLYRVAGRRLRRRTWHRLSTTPGHRRRAAA
ncbi:hemerythrin domain-containing protein [Streptomyces indicus]|uniref:Hemerythrin HHE cation binding domain-containing protein n=1 Tax=Streptomyces indicus TaxID=417292 RepID=A0A1G9J2U7_9ACTN|nr:hemerythrin domain-containing protein [Streptomyces indicus]SDL31543.1 Hemerythrin HHE cation binding domain-containing protein [Streptomyces indicus]